MAQEKFNFIIRKNAYPKQDILVAVMKAQDKDEVYQYLVKNFKKYVQFDLVKTGEELFNRRNGKIIEAKTISLAYKDLNQLSQENRDNFLMAIDGYVRTWYNVSVDLAFEIIEN